MSERNERALDFLKSLDIKTALGGFDKKATVDSLRALSDLYEEILRETKQTCDDRCAELANTLEAREKTLAGQCAESDRLRQRLEAAETRQRAIQAEADSKVRSARSELDTSARQKADRLLSDARASAADITENAKRDAEAIKKQADIEALRRKAAAEDSLRYIKAERANISRELALIKEQLDGAIRAADGSQPFSQTEQVRQ